MLHDDNFSYREIAKKHGYSHETIRRAVRFIEGPERKREEIKRRYRSKYCFVMEKYLGRNLFLNETIHHIDGNHKNNDILNLMLFPDRGKHLTYHADERKCMPGRAGLTVNYSGFYYKNKKAKPINL